MVCFLYAVGKKPADGVMDRKGSSGGIEARDGNPLKIPHYNNLSTYFEKCHDQKMISFYYVMFLSFGELLLLSFLLQKKKYSAFSSFKFKL